jgi:hypothetical protein
VRLAVAAGREIARALEERSQKRPGPICGEGLF